VEEPKHLRNLLLGTIKPPGPGPSQSLVHVTASDRPGVRGAWTGRWEAGDRGGKARFPNRNSRALVDTKKKAF
jgi:hypothetical protein